HLSLMRLLGADGAYCCDRFFFCDRGARRGLHSFPTRRSSDLIVRDAVYVIRIVAGDARRDRMLGADRLSLAEDPDPVAGLVRHRDGAAQGDPLQTVSADRVRLIAYFFLHVEISVGDFRIDGTVEIDATL